LTKTICYGGFIKNILEYQKKLWDITYNSAHNDIEAGGWFSSFDGSLFSMNEIEEFSHNCNTKIRQAHSFAEKILEIGVGSGFTLNILNDYCIEYHCIDISKKSIQLINSKKYKNVIASCLPAHEINKIIHHFDIIIINSVIHCFPDLNYLETVLDICYNLLNKNGIIFLGDIIDEELKDVMINDIKNYNINSNYKKTDFSNDLFVLKEFFKKKYNNNCLNISNKIYKISNELTKYRYDVIIKKLCLKSKC